MPDPWSDVGSFLSSVLGHSAKSIEAATPPPPPPPTPALDTGPSWSQIVGESMLQRGRPLGTLLGAALAGPGIRREYAARQAAIPKEAAAIASASGGRITPDQASALVAADPSKAGGIIEDLLKAKTTQAKRTYDPRRGGIVNLDTGQFEPIPGLPSLPVNERNTNLLNLYLAQNPNATAADAGQFLLKYRPQPQPLPPSIFPVTVNGTTSGIASVPRPRGGTAGTPSIVPLPPGVSTGKPPAPPNPAAERASAVTTAKNTLALATQVYDMQTPGIQRTLGSVTGSRAKAIASMRAVRRNGEIIGFTIDGKTLMPVP
jgi:hypothetical protein